MTPTDRENLEPNFFYYIRPNKSQLSRLSFRGKYVREDDDNYIFECAENRLSGPGYLGWMRRTNDLVISKTDPHYEYYIWADHPENKELKLKQKPFMHMTSKGKDNWWIGKSH